jgi:hypothetical protein
MAQVIATVDPPAPTVTGTTTRPGRDEATFSAWPLNSKRRDPGWIGGRS